LYRESQTVGGAAYPRYHNFRYAYNSASLASGGHAGGQGNVESGEVWILRDLFVPPEAGWHGASFPDYPADYRYPWGYGKLDGKVEHVMFDDLVVKEVIGGTDREPRPEDYV